MESGQEKREPVWISDAEDMLEDFREIDRKYKDILTPMKVGTIRRALKRGGHGALPEEIAKNYDIKIEHVLRVKATMKDI